MTYILNIHTATETAIINLIADEKIIDTLTNSESKQHASWLHVNIKTLLQSNDVNIRRLNAIGVSVGPGSYTGIRIGLAAAKGYCYALKIPLITYNTLELMARSAIGIINDYKGLYCPMIDARRMEVYTALYNYNMAELTAPYACILEENFLDNILNYNKLYFSGSGSKKLNKINKNDNAVFLDEEISTEAIAMISIEKFKTKVPGNIENTQPLYIKDFYSV